LQRFYRVATGVCRAAAPSEDRLGTGRTGGPDERNTMIRTLATALVSAAILVVLAVPVASASGGTAGTRDAEWAAPDSVMVPTAAAPVLRRVDSQAPDSVGVDATSAPLVVRVDAGEGFDWPSALVGAGIAAGAAFLAGGLIALRRRSTPALS